MRLEPLEDRRLLAVVTVTTLADTVDFNDGVTSLREAIFATNTVPGADTIDFAPALTAAGPATMLLSHGEFAITDELTIYGPSAGPLTIDAQQQSRIFNITATMGDYSIKDLRLTGGETVDSNQSADETTGNGGAVRSASIGGLTFERCEIFENRTLGARASGGGVFSAGTIVAKDSIVFENVTAGTLANGGGFAVVGSVQLTGTSLHDNIVSGIQSYGGGLFSIGNVTLSDSSLIGNEAAGMYVKGGGIYCAGKVDLFHSIVSGNAANELEGKGGGIYAGGDVQLVASAVNGNSAAGQAGIRSLGKVVLAGSEVNENHTKRITDGQSAGGGITADEGVNLVDSKVLNNVIEGGSGVGGGIASGGDSTITRCIISGNVSRGNGGGIYISANDDLILNESIVAGNMSANGKGGGIYGGSATVNLSNIRGNSAKNGGGGFQSNGDVTLVQSSVTGNTTNGSGGGIYVGGRARVYDSTVSENSARTRGGGIVTILGDVDLVRSTVVRNHASGGGGIDSIYPSQFPFPPEKDFHALSSIVAGNTSSVSNPDIGPGFEAVEAQYSLIGDMSGTSFVEALVGSPDGNGNLIGGPVHGAIDPLLGPLSDNGGFELPDGSHILTHALLAGSPAINAGDLNAAAGVDGVPEFDQRGEPFGRIAGGRIDIGAIEYQTPTDLNLLVDTLVDESDGDYSRGDLSLREAIQLANSNRGPGGSPLLDTIGFDAALADATILLTHGTLRISDAVSIVGLGADLLTIDASGSDPTPNIKNDDGSRVFIVDDGQSSSTINVDLSGLTVTGADPRNDIPGTFQSAILSREDLVVRDVVVKNNNHSAIVAEGGSLTVVDSVLQGNTAVGISATVNVTVRGSQIVGNGVAGIAVAVGDLTIVDCTISDNGGVGIQSLYNNTSVSHSSITGNVGGGIETRDDSYFSAAKLLTVTNCTIANNTSSPSFDGGGISARTGVNVVVADSKISGNVSQYFASGISVDRGDLEIRNSLISGNMRGGNGRGAIFFSGGRLSLKNTSITGNFGDGIRAGVEVSDLDGPGQLEIVNCTISGNRRGAAVVFSGESAEIRHSAIVDNDRPQAGSGKGIEVQYGTLWLDHSIVTGHKLSSDNGFDVRTEFGGRVNVTYSMIGNNYNSGLIEAPVGSSDANGNLIGGPMHGVIDPLLGPLADNGGFELSDGSHILTHALLAGSPAINAGDPAAVAGVNGVPVHDQRGAPFTRVYGGRIDIGAVEMLPSLYLPGDFNANGVVDAADYTVWRNAMGAAPLPGPLHEGEGDGNGDGVVDALDYAVWKSNYGATTGMLGAGNLEQGRMSSFDVQVKPPAEPGAVGRGQLATQIRGFASQPPLGSELLGRPGVREPMLHRAPFVAARQDRLLEAWVAGHAGNPHPNPLLEGEGANRALAEPVARGVQAGADAKALDCALAEMGVMRLAFGE